MHQRLCDGPSVEGLAGRHLMESQSETGSGSHISPSAEEMATPTGTFRLENTTWKATGSVSPGSRVAGSLMSGVEHPKRYHG